jgi:hypothetical protein
MRWPFRFTQRGNRVPQVPPVSAGLPSGIAPSNRPDTGLGLISDLAADTRKAANFVFVVGAVLVILALCIAGDCFAVMAAARELKGIPVATTVSVGFGGAPVLALIGTLLTRLIKNLAKGPGQTGSSQPPNGTAP